jgi:hypothetical protein
MNAASGGYDSRMTPPKSATPRPKTVARESVERSRALAGDMRRHADGVVTNLRRAARALERGERRAA